MLSPFESHAATVLRYIHTRMHEYVCKCIHSVLCAVDSLWPDGLHAVLELGKYLIWRESNVCI
jgi:hypothetical protein